MRKDRQSVKTNSGGQSLWEKVRGAKSRRRVDTVRPRRLHVEAMEPRYLLSGDGLIVPPLPTPDDAILAPLSQPGVAPGGESAVGALHQKDTAVCVASKNDTNEIIFVDPSIKDYQSLLAEALKSRPGQVQPGRVEVVVIDPAKDGIAQMTSWLDGHKDIQAVHVLSHGDDATWRLGTTAVTQANLGGFSQQLAEWNKAMRPGADLLLYGCDIAAGSQGDDFIRQLAERTGLDVAASSDATGDAANGGNWILEKATGSIEAVSLSDLDYHHLMATVTPTKSGDTTTTTPTSTDAFTAAGKLGAQLDASPDLGYTMPMADQAFASLIRTSDGRTLGDLIGFKTLANTTVLDDYLASTASPTMGGLMDSMSDYLNGTGAYSSLESWVSHAAGTPSLSFSASTTSLTVTLTLSRDFVSRFGFGDKLKPYGFEFAMGEGIPLVADVHLTATYDLGAGKVSISKLDARVKAQSATLSAPAVLGILDVNASGSITFDTGKIAFTAVAASAPADVKSPSDANYQSLFTVDTAVPYTVSAGLSFDLTGSIETVPIATVAGGVPHIDLTFNNSAGSNWSEVPSKTLTASATNFSQLQAFSSLTSTQLVKMMQDLGTYLQMLRDSGEFDALLPYTELKLGNALDFSTALNDIINNQLADTLQSGIVASKAIAPVFMGSNILDFTSGNASFDLYLQRPGDSRASVVTISVDQLETATFKHINELAELIGTKIAAAVNGLLKWQGSNFEVTETLKGGQTLAGTTQTSEEQTLKVHAAAGSYQLKLGASGTLTGPISVLASPTELQSALTSVLGAGTVVVSGRPKYYTIQFTGSKTQTNVDDLVVVEGSDIVQGSVVDVTTSDLSKGTDGKIWGRINLSMANPGEFKVFRVAQSAGVSVTQISPGTDTTEAVQRLTIVHSAGSQFKLSGTKVDNTPFTTGLIAADATTTTIAAALSAVLPGVTGLSVTDVSADYAGDNGTKVFDIGFGKSSATVYGSYAQMGVDTTSNGEWRSAMAAQGVLTVIQQPAPAVGATPVRNEIQRLSIANATGGQFAFGVTLGTMFYQSDWINLTGGAAAIKTALVSMLAQGIPGFAASDLTVTAVAGMANTFDITFTGNQSGQTLPQMTLNTSKLTSPAGSSTYGPMTRFGFLAEGQDFTTTNVTTFVTFNEMMDRFQQAVSAMLPVGSTFALNPRFDTATKSLLFDVMLVPEVTVQAVPLHFTSGVGALSALSVSTSMDLSTQSKFISTIGFDFANMNTFAVRASGAYSGSIVASAQSTTATSVVFDAPFIMTFDGESYSLTLSAASTAANTTRAQLVTSFQAVFDAQAVTGGGVLANLGFTNLGNLVKVGLSASGQLQLTVTAPISKATLLPTFSLLGNPLVTQLGFKSTSSAYMAPKPITLASNGQLTAAATFKLKFDQSGTTPISVTINPNVANTKPSDFATDLNTAFQGISVAGDAYLGTGGKGFSLLSDVVQAIYRNGQLEIVTLSPKISTLQILIDGNSKAMTELGFTPGQYAKTSGAYVFLQDAILGGGYSGVIHGQNGATPATLAAPGQATMGMLDLTFTTLGADYQGSLTFNLRNGLNGAAHDRVSLNALFDSATSQEALLGIGGSMQTSTTTSATSVPYQSNGQLLRDVGLAVTVGSLPLDVVVTRSSTLGNTTVNDLAADVDQAIHAALVAKLGSDPYVGFTFVTITNTGTGGATKNVLTFAAPTTTLTLAANPTQIYNATNGTLLTDLRLSVAVTGAAQPVDVLVRTSRASANTSLDQLVGQVADAIQSALASARSNTTDTVVQANIDALIAATDLVSNTAGVLTLKAGVVTAKEITLKNFAIKGRLLGGDYITPLVFLNQGEVVGTLPTAKLTFSGISIVTPTGVTASGLNPITTITIDVSNMVQALSGTNAVTVAVVVPADGLGTLTPIKDISWSSVKTDLGLLKGLLGNLGALGPFGELGRALPVLGSSVSEVFDFSSRFAKADAQLATQDSVGLKDLRLALATAFGIDPGVITLENDATVGQEALKITIPYRVVLNQSVPLDLLFNDSALLGLLSTAAKAELVALIGALRELKDTEGTSKCQLYADMTFNLALGIDLNGTSPNKGKLFLYDRVDAGAAGLSGDSGTFARLDQLSVIASGMSFESNQGIYRLGVTGGTATLNLAGSSGVSLLSDAADGASDGRLYLGAVDGMSSATLTQLKHANFEVFFDGSAAVALPLTLTVSDDLGQLAMQQIDGFINPLPLGKMELNFDHLGATYAAMGGKTGFTLQGTAEALNSNVVISSQVVQSALPERPSSGNGVAVTTPEGAPVDSEDESGLSTVDLNPFYSSSAGAGATTAGSASSSSAPPTMFAAGPQANAPSTGFDISLIVPDIAYWQTELTVVMEHAIGAQCEGETKVVNGPLLFLLRDPTIIVNTVDKVLETIQKGLDAFSDVLSLPIIGDQLKSATQFVADLRHNVVKSIKDALSSAIEVYGGLDNTLRMYMFNLLTTDTNHDFIIEANEVSVNPFLNFLQDYNGDNLITPDDIVVEYIAGTGTPKIDPALAEYLGVTQSSPVPAILPGQRTAWVTSGANVPRLDSLGAPILHADGTQCYIGQAGEVVLDSSIRKILDDISGSIDSMAATASDILQLVQSTGHDKSFFDSLTNVVTFIADKVASGYNYQSLLRDVFGAGVTAAVLPDVLSSFTPSVGALQADYKATMLARQSDPNAVVVSATLAELKAAVKEKAEEIGTQVALAQSTAIQFRMHLGQTYTPSLNLGFDIGVPGLKLNLDGGIQLKLNWNAYLGFGIDIKDGFYLITNMPGTAGIGEVTAYDAAHPGVATGVKNNYHDVHIDNLWLVGKPTFTPAVKEIQAQIDVFLAPGSGGGPARLSGQLLVLQGVLTDNWDGWIRDNDTGIWGSGTDSMGRLQGTQSATYGRSTTLFDGETGAEGSRTRLQLKLAVDLKDKGLFGISALSMLTNGRLTFNDFRTAKLSDLVAVEWEAKAQVNLHMELGLSIGGDGYLPKIMGDFHMTYQKSNKNENIQKIEKFFSSGYDNLFHVGTPNLWMTDVYLDVGTFFTKFLNPIVGLIQNVTEPIQPVIDALTTPIPGLSDLMGRDYSVVDLASDMSAMFGGISQIDFIVAMVNMVDVINHLPTDTAGMLIPVTQAFVISGTKDRKLNLSALPTIPGLPNIDIPVPLPYKELTNVKIDQDNLQFSLYAGVGWKQDTTLLNVFKGNTPPLQFDFALNADVKVPAPYIDVTPVNFTIPGLSGNFTLNIKAGWPELYLSDILSGNFAPRFDISVTVPNITINTQILPVLKVKLPTLTWTIGSKTWTWIGGDEVVLNWPTALQGFVDPNTVQVIDLGVSINPTIPLPSIPAFLPQIQVKWPTVHWIGLGKEYLWNQTDSTTLGWSSIISDQGLLAALVDNSKTITVQMPDIWLPSISLADLLPDFDFNFDFGLPGLPSLPDINIDLPDIDMPGQQTVSPKQAFNDFKDRLKKPGSALKFPILDDTVGSVIALLTGEPADLVTFTPNNLNLHVGFRVSFPIYPPLYVGLGGSIDIKVALTLGFDTYGIGKFFDSHNAIDILDGFYVSDNIVNGVDNPEITLEAKLFAFAELNVFIVRGGVEGGIKLTGTLDLYDVNNDGKMRASEIIAAVSEDPLDLVQMHLRGSAYIAAYVDVNVIFDWVRVWEWTFMDVTLFTWDHDPAAKKPVLGSMDGSVLTLHMGSNVDGIDGQDAIAKGAKDRLRRDTTDANESFTLTGSGGLVDISAVLPNGQTYLKTFAGVSRVKAFGGAGDDTMDASALDIPVLFIAGAGNDTLKGGSGNDVLIGSDSGTATLEGGGGNDLLIARGGTTTMKGGTGDDTYRFLGDWGMVTISDDGTGNNILDFTAQAAAVTFDDAYFTAKQGANQAVWDATVSIDVVKGGSGKDILDFSGDSANLLLTLTASNAGWVKGSASGMQQNSFDGTANADMLAAGDDTGWGFKFEGIENIIGGQGSDVFRIRDGASVSGSLVGDTEGGLYHEASGNEVANARNTIDFSEYTTTVTVDEEGASAFGSAGETNITVRGFHNIFGGSDGDYLSGDGRNNMIVGNDGTDFLEGKAAHDLIVADTFVTYKNLLSGQGRPADGSLQNVTDYLSLQMAGMPEFGLASRNWIWKGQTLESKNLTINGRQTLKGGSGNDIIMGSLGGDQINVGGSGEGNDTIMADLGKIEVDFNYRTALSATSFGSKGGGGDTINLGSGSNLVVAGSGRDIINGMDAASSTNIVLTDNGTIHFKTTEVSVNGSVKLTFAINSGRSHLLDYIEAPVAETGGIGSDDTVTLGSGSGIVFGGAGKDAITFTAGSSTGGNFRFIAGDHARIDTDVNGGVVTFKSLDLVNASGGDDTITVGSPNDLIARYLGINYVIAGVGSDKVMVSAGLDATTGVITSGAANSTDVILADNGEIDRWDSVSATTFNILKKVVSTELDQGGNDLIQTANGDKTIVGGFGQDTITVTTISNSLRQVVGDNGQIDYNTVGGVHAMTSLDTVTTTGDNDVITIAPSATTQDLGHNFIIAGMGADKVLVAASLNSVSGVITPNAATSVDVILGDNGTITNNVTAPDVVYQFLQQVISTQLDKGGNDLIQTSNGDKTIIGGYAQDAITVTTTSTS
ncbi:MAG: DUF4347 domain-containing protein, partial [Magnetococcales bacterium]|nr:DUF4347 domain-containing protein [Magnetococcales bacterium]